VAAGSDVQEYGRDARVTHRDAEKVSGQLLLALRTGAPDSPDRRLRPSSPAAPLTLPAGPLGDPLTSPTSR